MLDPDVIRIKTDFVKESIAKKGADASIIDKFLEIDNKRTVSYTHLTLPTNREV